MSVDVAFAVPATVTAGTRTFPVPALALNLAHTIAVTANDTALSAVPTLGNFATVNDSITVGTLPPTVAVTSPVTLPVTAPTNVTAPALTFTATDNFNVASTICQSRRRLTDNYPPPQPWVYSPTACTLSMSCLPILPAKSLRSRTPSPLTPPRL